MFAALYNFNQRTRRFRAALIVPLIALFVLLPTLPVQSAQDLREYAGIVVDAKSGKTLYAQAADAARYPASVTKVMTLYILFQELQAGRYNLKSRLSVSKYAAAAVPTKLGLPAGSTIAVEDAIKALVTLSANDIARVIAENISGSEGKFAVRMTETAHALGMSRTTYRNASGLPDPRQITTVRDQARLGVAVYQHFPKYYDYFQTRSFRYGKRNYGNHNQLLGVVPGVDGIKTGYIRAAGYNLLTAARRDDRHIVVVGFGFDSGASRNSKVAALIKKYMPNARRGSYLANATIARPGGSRVAVASSGPVIPMPAPSFRVAALSLAKPADPIADIPMPAEIAPVAVASLMEAPSPEPRPVDLLATSGIQAATLVAEKSATHPPEPRTLDVIGAWISQTLKLDQDSASLIPPLPVGQTQQTVDLLTSGAIGDAEGTDSGEIGWVVQVGAAPSEKGAMSLLASAAENIEPLTDYRRYIERFEKNGQVFYRARFAGFAGRDQAASMCDQIKKEKMSCLTVQG